MRKYWALYRTALQGVVAYRGTMFFYQLGFVLSFLAITSVWFSVDADGPIATYEKNELITYYILTLVLWSIAGWAPAGWIKHEIQDGAIVGKALLKPMSFYFRIVSEEFAWHSISTFVGLTTSAAFLFFLRDYFVFSLTPESALLVALAIVMATIVMCTLSLCIGLLAFWFTEISTIEAVFWALMSFLGGSFLPLTFLPASTQDLVKLLPFRYMTSFPIEIYFHKLSQTGTLLGFLVAAIWIVLLMVSYKLLWHFGVRNYKSWGQ